MIPSTQTQTREVISTMIPSPELSFSVKSLSNIFELLHKSMYNDKPTAVAREVISNAIDANIESKSKQKLIVKLPTKMVPIFSVQDFGIGIDKQRLECFSSYGSSTKTNTNKEIGGFGLGAKSPWSITDQFTITTVTGGVKYKYLCYMAEDGIGKVKELSATPTDEQSGTTMEIPVTDRDHIEKIKQQSIMFALCNPEKIYLISSEFEMVKSIYETKQHILPLKGFMPANYHMYKWGEYGLNDCTIILNGYVPYLLGQKLYGVKGQYCVVVKFDIGVLDLPATREILSNTPKNNRIITKITNNLAKSVIKMKQFLQERVYRDAVLGCITMKYKIVNYDIETLNKSQIHSVYRRCGGSIEKSDCNHIPTSPSSSVPNYLCVLKTESKNTKITFKQYAEHILEKNPKLSGVYFINFANAKQMKWYSIVPIHGFDPAIKPKEKVVRVKQERETTNKIQFLTIGGGRNFVSLETIKDSPDNYRRVDYEYSQLLDQPLMSNIKDYCNNRCKCDYELIKVNKGQQRYLKNVQPVTKNDFKIKDSFYLSLTHAFLRQYLFRRFFKSTKIYNKYCENDLNNRLNNIYYLNDQYWYFHWYTNKFRRKSYKLFDQYKDYSFDEQKFKQLKKEAISIAKTVCDLMEDDHIFMLSLLINKVIKDELVSNTDKVLKNLFENLENMLK